MLLAKLCVLFDFPSWNVGLLLQAHQANVHLSICLCAVSMVEPILIGVMPTVPVFPSFRALPAINLILVRQPSAILENTVYLDVKCV